MSGLPYLAAPTVHLLGAPIDTFAPIVVAGILIGAELMQRYGARRGIGPGQLRLLLAYVIVSGFIGAHLVEILAYQPHRLADEGPLLLLRLWDGISSFGGFLGGAIGQLLFVRWHRGGARLRLGTVFDTTGVGLLVAFTIGRIACTLVHDHVGRATDSVLGVDYPRAIAAFHGLAARVPPEVAKIRAHHLGMYELVWLLVIAGPLLYLAFRRAAALAPGQLAAITTLLYAPLRFGLDFLRLPSSDPRHGGLTFAQWGAIAVFVVAAAVLVTSIARRAPSTRVGHD